MWRRGLLRDTHRCLVEETLTRLLVRRELTRGWRLRGQRLLVLRVSARGRRLRGHGHATPTLVALPALLALWLALVALLALLAVLITMRPSPVARHC